MNSQKRGTDLKIHIKLALHSLGRDYGISFKGMKISDLEAMLRGLRKEQRELGVIK